LFVNLLDQREKQNYRARPTDYIRHKREFISAGKVKLSYFYFSEKSCQGSGLIKAAVSVFAVTVDRFGRGEGFFGAADKLSPAPNLFSPTPKTLSPAPNL
jgi:hypothetical protein